MLLIVYAEPGIASKGRPAADSGRIIKGSWRIGMTSKQNITCLPGDIYLVKNPIS